MGDSCSVHVEIVAPAELLGLTFAWCGGLPRVSVLGSLDEILPRE